MKKTVCLKIIFILIVGLFKVSSQNTDIWSGTYVVKSNNEIVIDTIQIKKVDDVKAEDVAGRFESDLKRWVLTSQKGKTGNKIEIRRFLFNVEDEENEYKQFGWTALYKKGEMKCIDGGHLFICKTKPNTKVNLSNEESFFTKTGIFGVRLHFGLLRLKRVDL